MARSKNGVAGMRLEQIMMQQLNRSIDEPVYCRVCGFDVKQPSNKSPGGSNGDWKQHLDWEIANRAHASCTQEHFSGRKQ